MISRHHLTEELQYRAIGKYEAEQSQVEVVRWFNMSPSVIHTVCQQFLTNGFGIRRFSQGRPCASTSGRSDIHVFSRGNVNAHTYRNDILDAYVHPYAWAIDDAFGLEDDNVRSHRARIMDAYLEQETIQSMYWPGGSLNLKTLEQVWDSLGRSASAPN
ncbi:DDE_3 domain-containing protein [Trichonephila clavipes]|nr:DDE_3 domain-containing protein [Trichonephila clavipes]